MTEKLTIISERVDDIPLLLAQLERMGVQPLLDEHFPTHGNWVGLSLGWVTVIWLTPILVGSEPSAEPWGTLGRAAAPHAARLHRAAGPLLGPGRRPAGRGPGGLE